MKPALKAGNVLILTLDELQAETTSTVQPWLFQYAYVVEYKLNDAHVVADWRFLPLCKSRRCL